MQPLGGNIVIDGRLLSALGRGRGALVGVGGSGVQPLSGNIGIGRRLRGDRVQALGAAERGPGCNR